MFEVLFEIFGEFLLQAIGEALLELGLHAAAGPLRRPRPPWLVAFGYGLFGLVAGGVSLWLFPAILVSPPLRVANLILTPLAVGGVMTLLGAWRRRRGETLFNLDRFAYGYLFALGVALIRFAFAR